MNSKHRVFTLAWVLVLSSCSNEYQINQCVYGVSKDIVLVEANVCGKTNVTYNDKGDYWEPEQLMLSNCDGGIVLKFVNDSGTAVKDDALYVSGSGEITSFVKYDTTDLERVHVQKSKRIYDLVDCMSASEIEFSMDFTRGEHCNRDFYTCED